MLGRYDQPTYCLFTQYNIDRIFENFRGIKTDLLVLPEFFSTGINHQSFINEPEDTNGGRIEVKPQSNQHNVSSEELQNLLNAIDNPNIPNFG